MLKHEVIIGILGSIFVLVLTGFYIFKYQQLQKMPTNINVTQLPNQSSGQQNSLQKIVLTPTEVSKHNNVSDCWIIVNNNVYNVTQYINIHPGGLDRISVYCGKDATEAFVTKGGKGSHSAGADQELASMMIGSLGAVIDTQTIKNSEITIPPGKYDSLLRRENDDD